MLHCCYLPLLFTVKPWVACLIKRTWINKTGFGCLLKVLSSCILCTQRDFHRLVVFCLQHLVSHHYFLLFQFIVLQEQPLEKHGHKSDKSLSNCEGFKVSFNMIFSSLVRFVTLVDRSWLYVRVLWWSHSRLDMNGFNLN